MKLKRLSVLFCLCFLFVFILNGQANIFSGLNGNHFLDGQINLKNAKKFRVEFSAHPTWIVGYEKKNHSVWYILLQDSSIHQVIIGENGIEESKLTDFELPPDAFLSLDIHAKGSRLFDQSEYLNNYLSHPIKVLANNKIAVITDTGYLNILDKQKNHLLNINPLIDSRILQNKKGDLLVLTGDSNQYQHGILGDRVEANGFAIIRIEDSPYILHQYNLSDQSVFETLQPIWIDINNDQINEIVITRSNLSSGAELQVYTEDGQLLASSAPIRKGFRWMHLLSVAPFGPDGELELAVVRTPHIGGRLEFYRIYNKKLEIVHARNGYSTHRMGSRNLDTALAGDFNNDGDVELLLPTQDFQQLDVIKRTKLGTKIDYSIDLSYPLSTNISSYSFNGKIYIAFGTFHNEVIFIYP